VVSVSSFALTIELACEDFWVEILERRGNDAK